MDINRLLTTVSSGYFAAQVITIIFLCVLGYVFIWAMCSRTKCAERVLLAFPAGLAFYCAVIYGMMVLRIRISLTSIVVVALVVSAGAFVAAGFYRRKTKGEFLPDRKSFSWKELLLLAVIGGVLACIATSGLLTVSLDNDSFYYYSSYPQMII
ncbi:MAG: hypothetical protein IJS86_07140, partial [Lachnospiraceae bacterium]|nr:hypothetical protein [Lachnospiraceae bacterium]